jgi:hypothetical protein
MTHEAAAVVPGDSGSRLEDRSRFFGLMISRLREAEGSRQALRTDLGYGSGVCALMSFTTPASNVSLGQPQTLFIFLAE